MKPESTAGSPRALRLLLLAAIVAAALPNAQFRSPLFDPVLFHLARLLPKAVTSHFGFLYLNAAFLSLMTAAIGGVPAGIYEWARGHKRSTVVSLSIWLAATLLLSWPSIESWLAEN
jgi:hypothetical protein